MSFCQSKCLTKDTNIFFEIINNSRTTIFKNARSCYVHCYNANECCVTFDEHYVISAG